MCLRTRSLIPGTALLSSLTSLIPFPLIPLISSPTLPQNLLTLLLYYALSHIPLTASLSSIPTELIGTLQSFSLHLVLMRLTSIPWNTLPSATNISALLITLIVATNGLSSYLLTVSYLPYLYGSPMDPFSLSLCVSAIISSLSFPCILACPLWACYCPWLSIRLCLPLVYKAPLLSSKALSLT
jgi:hypothetical protein